MSSFLNVSKTTSPPPSGGGDKGAGAVVAAKPRRWKKSASPHQQKPSTWLNRQVQVFATSPLKRGEEIFCICLFVIFSFVFALPVFALEAGESLDDPRLEARAVVLGEALRCPVCAGESVSDSPAPLARNMRAVLREKLQAGLSDEAILAYMRQRYGDNILFRPPFRAETLPLFLAPWGVLGLALLVFWFCLFKARSRLQR